MLQILLQKSFCTMIKNSAGRRFGFRVRMWRTSSLHVKRTGDFGNAAEGIRIGDQFPSRVFAKNSEPGNFRLLQQYLHIAAEGICAGLSAVGESGHDDVNFGAGIFAALAEPPLGRCLGAPGRPSHLATARSHDAVVPIEGYGTAVGAGP
jgi:hypothetical protein